VIARGFPGAPTWRSIDLADAKHVSIALPRSAQSEPRDMEQDPEWLETLATEPQQGVTVYSLEAQGELLGIAPFLVHPSVLQYRMGEVVFFAPRVRRHVLMGEPEIRVDERAGSRGVLLVELFRKLRQDLHSDDVVFLQAVPEGSDLYRLLTRPSELGRAYHVIPHGPLYHRRFISFTGDHASYLAGLRRTTRRDLRRSRRKFERQTGGRHAVACFETEDAVVRFLEEASALSRRTYQWNLLGLGLRDTPAMHHRLLGAARRGWLRSYILYADSRPVAFQLGYLHRGTFAAGDTGYDPDWAKCHAGIYLLMEMIRDLAPRARIFDFLHGDDLIKYRLSNRCRRERNFYLVPRGLRGTLLAHSLRATNALSYGLGRFLATMGVKDAIRRALRVRAASAAPPPASRPPRAA